MPKLNNAQEAFDATMMAMVEVLEEVNPEAARDLAQWNLEVLQKEEAVASFATSFDPGVRFHIGVRFEGSDSSMYFDKSLAAKQ
jgi:hypothetical protein